MAVELSVDGGTLGLPDALPAIQKCLSHLLGLKEQYQLLVEVRDKDEAWLEVASHPSQIQVLRFDIPSSTAGEGGNHINIGLADRTPVGIALMVATAIVLAEINQSVIVDDSCLFGTSEHEPSSLRNRVALPANDHTMQVAARSLCAPWGLASHSISP